METRIGYITYLTIILCCNFINLQGQIKLYSYFTPSHKILKEKYFLPSIIDDYEVIIREHKEQVCPAGKFYSKNWSKAVALKADLIIDAIKENWGDFFIYSDIDVQFIRPTKDYIITHIKNVDCLGQQARPGFSLKNKSICTGFLVIKANTKNLNLWKHIKKSLLHNNANGDQYYFNKLFKQHNVICKRLPISFYNPGKKWNPDNHLNIPKDIKIHHANWTIGVKNKIKQLEYVKSHIKNKQL
jgi:hypothetical protein